MAFVETATWSVEAEPVSTRNEISGLVLPQWLDMPFLRQFEWRRPVSLAATLIFHLLLIWFLLTRAIFALPAGKGEGDSGKTLSLFDLPEATANNEASPADHSATPITRQSATQSAPAISAQAPVPDPPEWSVSQIRVPRSAQLSKATNAAGATTPMRNVATPGGGGAASPGGSDIYDPYAGAAPMRREDHMASARSSTSLMGRFLEAVGIGPSAEEPKLNERLWEQARATMRRRFPGLRGSAELTVRISPTGQALDVQVRSANLDEEAIAFLKARLIGRPLFSVSSPGSGQHHVALPILTF